MRGFWVLCLVACAGTKPVEIEDDPFGDGTDRPDVDPPDNDPEPDDEEPEEDPVCIGTGFNDTPREWQLPEEDFGGMSFPTFANPNIPWCSGAEGVWFPTDLDADGRTDLVVPFKCDDADVGSTHWRVYTGGGDRFETPFTTWALPDLGLDRGYRATMPFGDHCGNGPNASWSLLDLTGDGALDLVTFRDCLTEAPEPGLFQVYENLGSGFATESTPYTTPTRYGTFQERYQVLLGGCDDVKATPTFQDIDADGWQDLVITRSCVTGDEDVGRTRWLVHAGGPTGFAESPTDWTLPEGFSRRGLPFAIAAAQKTCDHNSTPTHELRDMDGDARPDLLVTDDCDDSTGQESWRLFPNTGDGFGPEVAWRLPAPGNDKQYTATTAPRVCDGRASRLGHQTLDITGDGRSDLVFLTDCTEGSTLGAEHWLVHPGEEDGFAQDALTWPLPSSDGPRPFGWQNSQDCASQYNLFEVAPMVGDPGPELVVTSSCTDGTVGATKWLVYTPTCAD